MRIEMVHLKLDVLWDIVAVFACVRVEVLNVKLDLMEECFRVEAYGIVIGWLRQMLLPPVALVSSMVRHLRYGHLCEVFSLT